MGKKFKSGKRGRLGSYPSVSVIGSMFLALFVLGLFGLFLLISKNLTTVIQENLQFQIFLDKDLNENQITRIEKTLSSKEYVLRKESSQEILFISKEDAAKKFIEETGENFYDFLGENPLRSSFLINIHPDFQSTESLQSIKAELESSSGIFEVEYVESMLTSVNENIAKIILVLVSFASVLLLVVVILINNTIKLALFSQRFLIRSMQLVGATYGFIQKPFLYRSISHGMLSGLMASGVLYALLQYGNNKIEGLSLLHTPENLLVLGAALLIIGAFVGLFGTLIAIRRYLRMSLDELY